MSKDSVKTQIDTDITNKITVKSISPLNVGSNMKAIVDLIPEDGSQNLQNVLEIGSNATLIDNNTIINVNSSIDVEKTSNLIITPFNLTLRNQTNLLLSELSIEDGVFYTRIYNKIDSSFNTTLYFDIPTASTALIYPSKSAGIYTLATLDDIVDSRPYKIYTSLLSCTDSTTPVLTILENTIGNIIWTRNSIGNYSATLTGAFTIGKTITFTSVNNGYSVIPKMTTNFSTNSLFLEIYDTATLANVDYIENLGIEIRVYN